MSTHSNPMIIAIDVGHGRVKYCTGPDVSNSRQFFSTISMAHSNPLGLPENPFQRVEFNDKSYDIGLNMTGSRETRFSGDLLMASDAHEILLRAALQRALSESNNPAPDSVTLVLGLPVNDFVAHRQRLLEIGSRKRPIAYFSPTHSKTRIHHQFAAHSTLVVPQPFGALAVAMKQRPDLLSTPTLVVDVGFRTLDWFFANGMAANFSLSGHLDHAGAGSVIQHVCQAIADQFGGGLPNPLAVETALLQQTSVRHRKTTIDMNAPFVLSARDAAVTHAVSGFCGAAYEALRQAENLVLTGGGSVWFASVLKEHTLTTPKLLLPDSPGLANVLGYWLYGHSKQQAQGNSH